jgi:hypothetical protein
LRERLFQASRSSERSTSAEIVDRFQRSLEEMRSSAGWGGLEDTVRGFQGRRKA